MSNSSPLKIKSYDMDLSALFKNDTDPQIEVNRKQVQKANLEFIKKWKDRTDYLNDPKVLKSALDDYESLKRDFGQGGAEDYYFEIRSQLNQNDKTLKAKLNQAIDNLLKLHNDIQFFELNISKIPTNKQNQFLSLSELKDYKHFLEKLFKWGKYTLSEKEEKILNLKVTPSYRNWVSMTKSFISREEREISIKGKKKKYNLSDLMTLITSPNKRTRDSAAEALNGIFNKYLEVGEAEINSILEDHKTTDELRNLPRPDSERHFHDDIDTQTVDTLVETVTNRFDVSQRFYKLKAKLLGQSKLEYHERVVRYGSIDKKNPYDKAVQLVRDAFYQLDPEYSEIFTKLVEGSQIDVYPKIGKRGGACCYYNLISQPSYIFLNHTDTLRDVTTIAHEVGHGIQNEMMRKKQNSLNFGTPTSTAEVGSQFLEDFVLDELLKQATEEERLSIQIFKLDDDIAAIFRQIACYKFEQELHNTYRQKGYLSYIEIGQIFQKHMASYMGPSIKQSPGSENWWIYWPHIRNFFYVYSYSGGLIISKFMQSQVRKDKSFIQKVKQFQSAGMSDSPKEIFKDMGIDIDSKDFWNQGLDEVEKLLIDTENLARKLKKI